MPNLYLQHTVNVQIATDSTNNEALFFPEVPNALVTTSAFANQASGTLNVPAAGSTTLSFEGVGNVLGFYMKAKSPCTVAINGGTAMSLVPASDSATNPCKFFMEGPITSIVVANPAGNAAVLQGFWVVWGN